jgi:prepilin-type N-terminal cleavage/methylation domain-containing protein
MTKRRLDTELRPVHCPNDGFTLIELVIVLTILGAAVALAVVALGSQSSTGAQGACKNDYQAVQTATELYRQQTGVNPGGALPNSDPFTVGTVSGNLPNGWDGVKYLLGTVTAAGTTVGPWLRDEPLNAGHYEIAVQASPSSGRVAVFSTVSPFSQIGTTATVADCKSV